MLRNGVLGTKVDLSTLRAISGLCSDSSAFVFFREGQAGISPVEAYNYEDLQPSTGVDERHKLARIMTRFKASRNPTHKVFVFSRASAPGTDAGNDALTVRRDEVTARFLSVTYHVSPENVRMANFGRDGAVLKMAELGKYGLEDRDVPRGPQARELILNQSALVFAFDCPSVAEVARAQQTAATALPAPSTPQPTAPLVASAPGAQEARCETQIRSQTGAVQRDVLLAGPDLPKLFQSWQDELEKRSIAPDLSQTVVTYFAKRDGSGQQERVRLSAPKVSAAGGVFGQTVAAQWAHELEGRVGGDAPIPVSFPGDVVCDGGTYAVPAKQAGSSWACRCGLVGPAEAGPGAWVLLVAGIGIALCVRRRGRAT